MNLAALQHAMGGYLVDAPENNFAKMMRHSPGLGVYRNNYRGSLLACLRDTYEKCWAWLGDEGFDAAASAYIDQCAPTSWTLDAYGHDFDQALHLLYPNDPEIAELAWLEWAMRRAFDGPDAVPVDATHIANVDWERVSFSMIPTLKLSNTMSNAAAIWSALDADEAPPAAQLLSVPAALCVWRQGLSPCFRTLNTPEVHLLDMAIGGMSFGSMCQQLAEDCGSEVASALAGTALGQWLRDGLIAKLN